jgi:hypothetical protein
VNDYYQQYRNITVPRTNDSAYIENVNNAYYQNDDYTNTNNNNNNNSNYYNNEDCEGNWSYDTQNKPLY